mmetsp:Transcript_11865/g.30435  ORF Transcript_11865/g.30435 Transcript_11865/m.30435 type:complete len:387 (+) Transcript_11865:28-1188(+)
MGCMLSSLRTAETKELYTAMKILMDGSWGKRHELIDDVVNAVLFADDPSRLDISVRYKGWNALHIAAYHGAGSLMYRLCGDKEEAMDLKLASSINHPQGASVLMCIAYGKTSGLCTAERAFEQAGFKMVYRMTDAQLNYTDRRGCTALHYAAVHGVVDMVSALIERNMDIEARGIMNEEETMGIGLSLQATEWLDESKDENGDIKGWQSADHDTKRRTPLEMARMRYKYMSKFLPNHANSQDDLRSVIEVLEKATVQPEVPMAVPVITRMLTVAAVPAGQTMNVATPKGSLPVQVPSGCEMGMFFQFDLPEPIAVAEFRAWPRQMAVNTTTTTTTTHAVTDADGDGHTDVVMTTTTTTTTVTAETKDIDGDGRADGIVALPAPGLV